MILHESNLVKVEFDSAVPCITWTPLEFMAGDQFRQPFEIGIKFFAEKSKEMPNLISWLNDTRKLKAVKIEDVAWVNNFCNQPFSQAGGKQVAFVLPENVFGRMGTRLYVETTNKNPLNPLEIKAFKTLTEAKLWLKGSHQFNIEDVKI